MILPRRVVSLYYRGRSQWWRVGRLLFPSPAEMKFIKLMGGTVFSMPIVMSRKTGFPFAIVLWRGHALRKHKMKREVRVGKCFVDFGNDIKWGIEILGFEWHTDVLAEQQREDYIKSYDWRVLYIPAADLWRKSKSTKRRVLKFLSV